MSFEKLIELVEQPMPVAKKKFWKRYTEEQNEQYVACQSNLYGAVAVIMQDYVEEFIDFFGK